MTERCNHEGWGRYANEDGPCPPAAELIVSQQGVECPICGYHMFTYTGSNAINRMFMNRETATLSREVR